MIQIVAIFWLWECIYNKEVKNRTRKEEHNSLQPEDAIPLTVKEKKTICSNTLI
jgi:hypothetical protein